MPHVLPLIDWRTNQPLRFYLAIRREFRHYDSYCVACGVKVPEHEGPWVYGMTSLDVTLCEACGQQYAPHVMRDLRNYYDYIRAHQATRPDDKDPR
ncbi:MAG: hypothetical protein ACYCZF_03790 [Anaerolineae bacterium]